MQFAATAFATAFTIIDPIGMIPLTLAVTAGVPAAERGRIVDRAVVIAAAVVLVTGVVGRALLSYLGITIPAFFIAGGILLFLIAIDMLFARKTGARQTDEEEREGAEAANPAVFPLAVPMLAGPGTIATVLLLVGSTHGEHRSNALIAVAYAAALLAAWACMRAAALIVHRIGNTGIHVVTRLLGIVLAALAVQFVLNGLESSPLFPRATY